MAVEASKLLQEVEIGPVATAGAAAARREVFEGNALNALRLAATPHAKLSRALCLLSDVAVFSAQTAAGSTSRSRERSKAKGGTRD